MCRAAPWEGRKVQGRERGQGVRSASFVPTRTADALRYRRVRDGGVAERWSGEAGQR
jgi:hypothetical protein